MILVFGSINVDLVLPVPYWPAAGETVLGGDYAVLPGGKGANQALAARRAGATVALAGAVGRDGFAATALDLLRQDGVDLALVRTVARPTGCAAVIVAADGENRIAVASGANMAVTASAIPDDRLGAGTVLVLQMEIPAAETVALIGRARRAGARVMLNLAPAAPLDPAVIAQIDILVANAGEATTLDPAARPRQALVVTRGAAGATAALGDGSRIAVPALAAEIVDTTGAGDTFVGVLAAALDDGLELATALRRASAAAALSCQTPGAQPGMPRRAAIDAATARLPP